MLKSRGSNGYPRSDRARQALDLYCEKNISLADAYNACLMLARGEPEVYTYDTDFDKIEGIVRLEP